MKKTKKRRKAKEIEKKGKKQRDKNKEYSKLINIGKIKSKQN